MHARLSKRAVSALAIGALGLAAFTGTSVGASKALPPNPLKADLAKVAGLKPQAREDKLHQLAVAEGGQVNVYTSLSALVVKAVQSAWAAEYPDVTLNLYRGASEDVPRASRARRQPTRPAPTSSRRTARRC